MGLWEKDKLADAAQGNWELGKNTRNFGASHLNF